MRKYILLLSLLLLTACARSQQAPGPSAEAPAPPKDPENSAVKLFPTQDTRLRFNLTEAGPTQSITEDLLREPGRAVAVQEGKPYATWVLNDQGVWRTDPKGGGALLLYLPADLTDGKAWQQPSGGATVWFRLRKGGDFCDRFAGKPCWTLTVLNRGEQTTLTFVQDMGPIYARSDNWAQPAQSFRKDYGKTQSGGPTAEQRAALLKQAAAPAAKPAPVTSVTLDRFDTAVGQMLADAAKSSASAHVDLNADGADEIVLPGLDTWTTDRIQVYLAGGKLLRDLPAYPPGSRHRARLVTLKGQRLLLYEVADPKDPTGAHWFQLLTAKTEGLLGIYGWHPKADRTRGNEITWDDGGNVTVRWNMGDPAGHTRIMQYSFQPSDSWPMIKAESTRYAITGAALTYPTTPEGVLQAAFIARWYGFTDELPRYFATPEAAAVLSGDKWIVAPYYEPGDVKLGAVKPPDREHFGEVTPTPIGADGTTGFYALWHFYESSSHMWGKVTFGKDAQGRPVIIHLQVDGKLDTGI